MNSNEVYIQRCIDLAKKGSGYVSPNPLVGCVIVKDNEVISEGFHSAFGSPHAEADAINKYSGDLTGTTLYVNLEPCSHFGKTPPCTDLIIKRGIKKVVIGHTDPNPLVDGKGVDILKSAGIEVVSGVLEEKCRELNRFFLKFHSEKRPFITLKIAQTLDGKIADSSYASKWITGQKSRVLVHNFRSEFDAVLVGLNTVMVDNPFLDTRFVNGRNPTKIVLDKFFGISLSRNIFLSGKTIVVTSEKNSDKESQLIALGHKVIYTQLNSDGGFDFITLLPQIAAEGIISIFVEGGSRVFSSFMRTGFYDEIILFSAPKILGSGIPALENIGVSKIEECVTLKLVEFTLLDGDILTRYLK
ncbi:MAG TPA: bifunctional diaminohydroxyphosphoribosylaminopyrimidine deaminase/5-amino-6-(5-phosphoribosylamino)uracil reductase RibD [Ignavibacteriaceae bacterium]|nr:bifunctional diaminohydroxyphosphoribosylaminopyrimidine deaminase/5-amino-6-(5-phosphoribosylamino)uracil reductase RibD [Ignavibacteriaceae bacterium]HOJ18535.1 bifunctional diaminohydroxyphosphoribosylaminopyrimidine deaminase/5-amino-6-(5-phosphoribosylamino)uracil reductase RibD [Ignavibacteriaceae bacterium]